MTDNPSELVSVPVRGPGHCDDDGAWAEFVRQYDGKPRSHSDLSDFAIANRVFMADRNDLDLIVWQTAAKERIRWLSIELAKAQAAPAAPQAAGVGEIADAVAFMDAAAVMLGRGEMPAPGSDYAAKWYHAHATLLSALRAPSREPEGGAVDIRRIVQAACMSYADGLNRGPVATRKQRRSEAIETAVSALTPKEAPAATGAGENFRAQVVNLLDELIAHIVAIGPDKPNLNTPMSRRVWREVFADLITALRAKPQAREEAQPVKVTWVDDALNEHDRRMYVDGQQWAKVYGWDKSSLNARCNRLQAAMESPPTQPLAEGADAEKLRVAVEALEPFVAEAERIRAPYSAETIMDNVELWQFGSVNITRTRLTYGDLRKAVAALAALQQEGK